MTGYKKVYLKYVIPGKLIPFLKQLMSLTLIKTPCFYYFEQVVLRPRTENEKNHFCQN